MESWEKELQQHDINRTIKIEKAFEGNLEPLMGGDIEKARSGIYVNTPENKKKGRVGQKYGSKKAKVATEKEDKSKSKVTKEQVSKVVEQWRKDNNSDLYFKIDDLSTEYHNSIIIEPSMYKWDKKYDGMQINFEDGVYEVAEMQAGKHQEDIKVFLETKSLKSALNSLNRGNTQKPKEVIDMAPYRKRDAKKEKEQVYFETYSGAVQTARKAVEDKGYEISGDDWWTEVNTGKGRPKDGDTTKHSIALTKDGKPQKKALQIQVYNRGTNKNTYELNYYIS